MKTSVKASSTLTRSIFYLCRRLAIVTLLLCLGITENVAYAGPENHTVTVTEKALRGISRRETPVGERPLLIVPPFEDVKQSDTGTKDFSSYLVRTSLYRKENGKYVLIRREDSAFSQQQALGGTANEVWKKMKFDDYIAARPGLIDYDKLSISDASYIILRDAECNTMSDGTRRLQCLEFRRQRHTEWLDGLLQKNDTGDVITENNVPLKGTDYNIAAAPLELVTRSGVTNKKLANYPCDI